MLKANLEGDVLVRRASVEPQDGEAGVVRLLEVVLGGLLAVDQVRVEHVELVALGDGNKKKTPDRTQGRGGHCKGRVRCVSVTTRKKTAYQGSSIFFV